MKSKYVRSLITAPVTNPITLAETKEHLRITATDEDDYIILLIKAVTKYTENYLSRSLIEQTLNLWFDQFPLCNTEEMIISAPPLMSVEFIKYYDENQDLQTWDSANYVVDVDSTTGLVYPVMGGSYPGTRFFPKSVNVQYVAGYENSGSSPVDYADTLPDDIKQAMYMLAGHMFENREATTPGIVIQNVPIGYAALLANYKIRSFG